VDDENDYDDLQFNVKIPEGVVKIFREAFDDPSAV